MCTAHAKKDTDSFIDAVIMIFKIVSAENKLTLILVLFIQMPNGNFLYRLKPLTSKVCIWYTVFFFSLSNALTPNWYKCKKKRKRVYRRICVYVLSATNFFQRILFNWFFSLSFLRFRLTFEKPLTRPHFFRVLSLCT